MIDFQNAQNRPFKNKYLCVDQCARIYNSSEFLITKKIILKINK